jgi:predicted  nucleic acid-binding Zn-ribbon protein
MDKCFPSKRKDHIVGFGGGVKARHLRSPSISKAELIEKLKHAEDEKRAMQEENKELREENRATNNRVSRMEKEWEELKNRLSGS